MRRNFFSFGSSTLLFLLAIKGVAAAAIVLFAGIGLGPDEAQYWTWSQHLDWGYYSKPPGIAWQIALGTALFGNTEWGVRCGAILLSCATVFATYALAKRAGCLERTALWSAAVMAFTPLGWLSSLFAITDTGYILFWTLAACVVVHALEQGKPFSFLWIGVWVFCGALFKWPIYLFWVFVLLFSRPFFSWRLLGGICFSGLSLLPSVVWNGQHEWATFRHVFSTVVHGAVEQGTNLSMIQGNFGSFLGAQAALLSPVIFGLYGISFCAFVWNWKKVRPALRFCGFVSFCLFGVYLGLSFEKKMQGNWCVFAYPTGIAFLCWFFCEQVKWGQLALRGGLAVGVLFTSVFVALPQLQERQLILPLRFSQNPFKHNLGWEKLGYVLKENPSDFVFGDRYQVASELSFYGPLRQAYFMNLQNLRKNQFSFWPTLVEEQFGKTGVFVVVENEPHIARRLYEKVEEYREKLLPYFSRVEVLGVFPLLESAGAVVKAALLIRCEGMQGCLPEDPKKY